MTCSVHPSEIRVALLAGGNSSERSISLASGKGAGEALQEAGFRPIMLDPAKKEDLTRLIQEPFDVAFIALHGKGGEDGSIQGLLELIGLPYTGPGVWSSATALDKPKAKELYRTAGIPTPQAVVLRSPAASIPDLVQHVGRNCVVKAATEGSALGVYVCNNEEEIAEALVAVFEIDNEALVERYIKGEEYTVAVLGSEHLEPLPVIRIIPINEFYDFESKYAQGGSQHICPAPLPAELSKQAQNLAVAAHRVLECKGVSRSDLILDEQGKFWLLETNTVPGMTATSLLPDAARAAGISFPQLCMRMVFDALEQGSCCKD